MVAASAQDVDVSELLTDSVKPHLSLNEFERRGAVLERLDRMAFRLERDRYGCQDVFVVIDKRDCRHLSFNPIVNSQPY